MLSCGRAIIHSHVEIGAGCTIDKGVSGDTIIGEGTKIDNLVHIGHDTVIGKNCLMAAQVGIAGVVTIEDEVILPQHGSKTRLQEKLAAKEFVVSVELDPPKGLNPAKILEGAASLQKAGVDCINIADSPMARVRMSCIALARGRIGELA